MTSPVRHEFLWRMKIAGIKTHSAIKVIRSVTIDRPAEELFGFWRKLENLPRIMEHLESVQVLDAKTSHWRARGPAGRRVEWDAEVINEHPNELIAWRSRPGAQVDNAGSVRFTPAPAGRGTQITVALDYTPPAGTLGKTFAKLFGKEPAEQIEDDLRRFKQLMETGEAATIEGQPAGPEP